MARDITDLGSLSTRTTTEAASITGNEDEFSLPNRNELRSTDWYTFNLSVVATSLNIRSTPRPQSHDMVGWLYAGTITATSAIADLGSPIEFNDDGGANLNFGIFRTNQAVGHYTIAVQRYTTDTADYGLEIVAVVPGAPTVPNTPSAPSVSAISSTSLSVSWAAPDDGGDAITGYDVQYREGSAGSFTTWAFSGTGTSTTITGLSSSTSYQVQVRAQNSVGESNWSSSGAATTKGPDAVVTLEIDWGNDGTFSHASADVTVDLVRHSLRATRGRTLQSRRKATAGRLEAKLWNRANKYDPVNSSSPIYEKDLTGIRVRVKLAGTVVWSGILDAPRYRRRPVPQLDIIALGRLSTLRQPVSVATQTMSSIGEIAKLVGGATGITTTYLTGGKVLDRWKGVDAQDALSVLQDLEEYEEGFLLERQDGELALEAENARSTGASAVSALTLTDQIETATDIPLLEGSALDWGFRYVANAVYVPVTELSETGEITMITGAPNPVIPAGGTRELLFSYPAPYATGSRATHQGAASWTEPVAGTDYTAQNGLTVTGTVEGEQYRVRFENSSGQAITVDDLEIRGKAVESGIPVIVSAKDAASIARFGEREYTRPSPLFTTIGAAQEYADGIISRRKVPHGWLVARWPAYLDVAKARALDVSRRITVERQGETAEYFIEGIGIAMRGFVRMEYLLSPVPGATVPSTPIVTVARISGQDAQLAVSWAAPYDGGSVITDYDVRYKRSTDSTWTDWPHSSTGRTATITGLEQGGFSYDVQVRATNSQGMSSWSASGTARTPNQAPFTPGAPIVVGGKVILAVSWAAPYDGGSVITDYDVRYKRSTDSTWTDWPHSNTGRMATITGVDSFSAWDVQVLATNSQGMSSWSASGTATPTEVYTLYTIKHNFNDLYTVNPTDASVTLVGRMGGRNEISLAGIGSTLYTLDGNDDGAAFNEYELITIDPSNASTASEGELTAGARWRGLTAVGNTLYTFKIRLAAITNSTRLTPGERRSWTRVGSVSGTGWNIAGDRR